MSSSATATERFDAVIEIGGLPIRIRVDDPAMPVGDQHGIHCVVKEMTIVAKGGAVRLRPSGLFGTSTHLDDSPLVL